MSLLCTCPMGRDGVLEASASARGGLEAVFFSWLCLTLASHGLASVSTLLPRPRLCLIVSASVLARYGRWPCLGLVVISQLKRASAHGAQVQV